MRNFKKLNFIYDKEDKLLSIVLNEDTVLDDFKLCSIKGTTLIFVDKEDKKNVFTLSKEEQEYIKISDFIAIVEINNVGEFYFLKAKGKMLAETANKRKINNYI